MGKGGGGKGGKGGKGSKGGKGGKGGKKGGKNGKNDNEGGGNKADQKALQKKREDREREGIIRTVKELEEEKATFETFAQIPLSKQTKESLKKYGYENPTEIQQKAIPAALKGRDVLGAAKTGSGKTLSFVVPAVELMYRTQWTFDSGLGVLIVAPTRELATQIFDTVKIVGAGHEFNGGLIVGGSNIEEESGIVAMNLIVATPGRLMHHIDCTVGFELSTTMMLVLDEADRLLDLGFKTALNNILDALPRDHLQTLLFSATQTKDLDALSRMAVKNPYYVSVHSQSRLVTPKKLCQNFTVLPLKEKLSAVYSFLKKHVREKTIIFLSTCNQVRFVYLALSRLLKKDGACTMCLTGKMKPAQRKEVYDAFCQKTAACLFCTDIAARGLDFPKVKWVVQADCPDTVDTYIHRVGRTARAGANGTSLLFLTPQEELFLKRLADRRIRLREVLVNPKHMQNLPSLLTALNVQDPELKVNAQKAVVSYLRSVYFETDKTVFDVQKVDPLELSLAMGLNKAPTLKFVDVGTKDQKNMSWELRNLKAQHVAEQERSKKEKKWTSAHQSRLQEQRNKLTGEEDEGDDDSGSDIADLLVKRTGAHDVVPEAEGGDDRPGGVAMSKRAAKKLRKGVDASDIHRGTHVMFDGDGDSGSEDDEGKVLTPFARALRALQEKQKQDGVTLIKDEKDRDRDGSQFAEDMKRGVAAQDVRDKERERERIREKKRREKQAQKEIAQAKLGKKRRRDAAALGGDDNDDDDDEDAPQLIGASDDGSFESNSDDEGVDYTAAVDQYGNVDSSEDESEDAPAPKAKRARIDNTASAEELALRLAGA